MPRDAERKRATNRAWYERNKQHVMDKNREWRENNAEQAERTRRNVHYMKKYGITVEQYEQMLADQGGVCAIEGCGKGPGKARLHVDHCHRTGKVRRLLCSGCNTALGYLENAAWVAAAQKYLAENA